MITKFLPFPHAQMGGISSDTQGHHRPDTEHMPMPEDIPHIIQYAQRCTSQSGIALTRCRMWSSTTRTMVDMTLRISTEMSVSDTSQMNDAAQMNGVNQMNLPAMVLLKNLIMNTIGKRISGMISTRGRLAIKLTDRLKISKISSVKNSGRNCGACMDWNYLIQTRRTSPRSWTVL